MFLSLLSPFALPILQANSNGTLMWYFLIVLIILLLLLLFWYWWQPSESDDQRGADLKTDASVSADQGMTALSGAGGSSLSTPATASAVGKPAVTAMATAATEVKPDDLTRIEGIGPKISGILHEAGIHTFAQLATGDVATLQSTLEGKVRIFFPDTWPEQAALAAKGDWDALAALQDTFKAGRRQ
ncbi:MAG: DUF4332 domain-containing protein [Chloroflexi bacterium]|nr:DUF4332 domain-containing protein [Chloroflexota bacterium]